MIKIHARVTKEIEITEEQAERLVNNLCGCVEHSDIQDILEMFMDGVESGDYENGYIPESWLHADLDSQLTGELADYFEGNCCFDGDIELLH